jgi:hypothetical protein
MNRYRTAATPLEPVASTRRSTSVLAALSLAVIVASPHVLTVSRAVVNLPVSAVGVTWGRAHGGTCDVHDDLVVTCKSMESGFTNAGTTVGNVWLYDNLGGPDRHRHEARHADQWAMLGPLFPVLYGAESMRTRGDFEQSVFERWAGLHDGGYTRHIGPQ